MILFETQSQPVIFLLILLVGFVSGFVFDISKYIVFLCNKNKVVQAVLDVVSLSAIAVVYFLSQLFLNYGQFRFYLLMCFVAAILFQRVTVGKIIAKVCLKCYNALAAVIRKRKSNKTNENNAKM